MVWRVANCSTLPKDSMKSLSLTHMPSKSFLRLSPFLALKYFGHMTDLCQILFPLVQAEQSIYLSPVTREITLSWLTPSWRRYYCLENPTKPAPPLWSVEEEKVKKVLTMHIAPPGPLFSPLL